MKKYVVATVKDWHIQNFKLLKNSSQQWTLIKKKEDLNLKKLLALNPRYIFFPHWSWIVPDEIINNFECVCFHSSDVPYGRGGSPIQNLIIRGHNKTKITALRMTKELDAGPVYLKKPLSLKGKAQDIFENSAEIVTAMMKEIVKNEPQPKQQKGKAVVFKRRTQEENKLPEKGPLSHLYNHIRMLDAESYPQSFIEYGNFNFEFSDAQLEKNSLIAKVRIKIK